MRFGRIRRLFSRRGSSTAAADKGAGESGDALSLDEESKAKSEAKSEASLSALSPKDAFLRFDADSSGDIDEDEFFALLEAVGIKGKLEYQESCFGAT